MQALLCLNPDSLKVYVKASLLHLHKSILLSYLNVWRVSCLLPNHVVVCVHQSQP